MKHLGAGAFALLAVLFGSSTALAQICAGFPTVDRQFSFGTSLAFPEDATRYGVEGSYNVQGPFAAFGGVLIDSPEGDGPTVDNFYGGGSFDLLGGGLGGAASLSVCPTVRLGYRSVDAGSTLTVPVGVGVGTSISIAPTAQLMPYVVPQYIWARFSPEEGDASTDGNFGVRGGLLVGFDIFFVGGEIDHTFEDNVDPVFGIRVGVRL